MRVAIALAALVIGTFAAPAFGEQEFARSQWSERGVFVFGDIALDFGLKTEVWGPIASVAEDCSTGQFYCVRARIFNVVLPKRCGQIQVGDRWSVGDVTTEVLDEIDFNQSPLQWHKSHSNRLLFLGSEKQPNTIYEYDPEQGVIALFYDFNGTNDFVRTARSRQFRTYYEAAAKRQPWYFGLVSLDFFGRCKAQG